MLVGGLQYYKDCVLSLILAALEHSNMRHLSDIWDSSDTNGMLSKMKDFPLSTAKLENVRHRYEHPKKPYFNPLH